MQWLLFLSILMSGKSVWAGVQSIDLLRENNRGVEQLQKDAPAVALDHFLKALEYSPLQPEVHYNMGLNFYNLGKAENAEKSYQAALKMSQDSQLRFRILFNLGEMYQKSQKKDLALAFYQKALEIDSQNVQVKTNIELMMKDSESSGQGESQQNQDQNQNQDQKQNQNQNQDQEQKQNDSDGPKKQEEKKPQKPQFKSQDLTPGDVSKILGEIKQQEQKIRAEFNKKETKEKPRDKDW